MRTGANGLFAVMARLVPAIHALLYERVVKMIPGRIAFEHQSYFPFARPVLHVVLALDGSLDVFVVLKVNETAGTCPRLSGTVCAFMPPSPLRHKPDLQDAVARFASRLVRGRTLSVAQDLEVAISGEVQRSRADASGLLE